MKKLFAGIITLLLFAGSSLSWGATVLQDIQVYFDNIQININDEVVESEDEPFIYDNRVYVPLRTVSEGLKQKVIWDAENKTVVIGEKIESELLEPTDPYKGEAFVYGEIMKIDYDNKLIEIEQHMDDNSREVFEALSPTEDAIIVLKRNEHQFPIHFEDVRVGDIVGIILTVDNEIRGMIVGD
ncbi:copper amine oxidase N-terminal domain-containing protein [Alkaliphilus hydrothermalis]|uniref:Copper amine oxidase-like N-terminal domain-containing protein n=1 Tax=Alkaliphilus hydrothermalis TaxID=1482730 RepID=A0ABS2NMR4_9FIRM|nr:copper amine oxidase N-terminal domain-containing protein [Alkaliphilus hydrothermalis]MBM7614234.1 hypothetical protein [Alkaliphilus hydrothermalis]